MRSFTSSQATDMERLLWFSLLLTHLPVTESMDKCLTQPDEVILGTTGNAAVLPCNVSSSCPYQNLHYEWFVFKENSHSRLNLQSNPSKYSLHRGFLHVESLNANDSGIYYCAAVWPGKLGHGAQYVGLGTTLVVRGHDKPLLKHILLWLSFVLLAIYSLALVAFIILKKYGWNMSTNRRMCKTDEQNKSTKKRKFHDVLQEMYSKQAVGRHCSHVEAASTEFNGSGDEIYQNV
uniref:immunoglobulin superfamily member 6 n=1 Tax=Monopterus albus TaxID=43700 RepID=UPI0009B4232F|nr:immunoglobulin superfamily member 6 [Monopterus albus]